MVLPGLNCGKKDSINMSSFLSADKLYEFSTALLTDESVDSKAIAFDTVFYNQEDVYRWSKIL